MSLTLDLHMKQKSKPKSCLLKATAAWAQEDASPPEEAQRVGQTAEPKAEPFAIKVHSRISWRPSANAPNPQLSL